MPPVERELLRDEIRAVQLSGTLALQGASLRRIHGLYSLVHGGSTMQPLASKPEAGGKLCVRQEAVARLATDDEDQHRGDGYATVNARSGKSGVRSEKRGTQLLCLSHI